MSNRRSALEQRIRAREESFRTYLPQGAPYAILRVDGRAFSTYTRGLPAPVDPVLMDDMDAAAIELCSQIAGSRGAFVVSDEISVVIASDKFGKFFFDGAITKIVSVCAGIASAVMSVRRPNQPFAVFDGRVSSVDSFDDVVEYLVWRQTDGQRNAISMAAESVFSHKELLSMSTRERLAGLQDKGFDYDSLPAGFRHGRWIVKENYPDTVTFTHGRTKKVMTADVVRSRWVSRPAPEFRDWAGEPQDLFSLDQ